MALPPSLAHVLHSIAQDKWQRKKNEGPEEETAITAAGLCANVRTERLPWPPLRWHR
jgi:hypothetical protein